MNAYLSMLIVGLGVGAAYAALATGLVAIHKGTGILNFAQGAMAMWGVYVYDEIRKSGELVLPVGRLSVNDGSVTAFTLSLLSSAVLGVATHLLVFRPLRTAPQLAKVVATIGIMLAVQALVVLRFTSQPRSVAPILPNAPLTWGDLTFSRDRLYLAVIAVLAAAGMWAWFRFTRTGLATRAASENETAASLFGYSPDLLAGITWGMVGTVTGIVTILAAPVTGLNPINYTLYVVPALSVALVARLRSLGTACAAGLLLGAFQSEITFLGMKDWWPSWAGTGAADALPFVIIVVCLFLLGRGLPGRGGLEHTALPQVKVPRMRPVTVAAWVLAGLALLALTRGSYRFGLVSSMIMAVIALSLVVLTGLVGQISLAQAAFAGAAGFALSKFGTDLGLPFPLSLLAAGAVAAVLGVLVGLPALRIRGAQLALVTLAGAVTIERLLFRNPELSAPGGELIEDATLFGVDLGVREGDELVRLPFAVMVLVVLALAAVAVGNLARSDTGRAFLAVRSNERAAAAAGINVAHTKLLAFAVASFLAGVGGCLIGYSRGQLSVDSFSVLAGLSFLAFAYLGGITSIPGAMVAGLLAPSGLAYVFFDRSIDLGEYYVLASGLGLVLTAVLNPNGIAAKVGTDTAALLARLHRRRGQNATPAAGGPGTVSGAAPRHHQPLAQLQEDSRAQ
ncbi:ABC transporter permease [Streptomyces sp. NPDC012935]|uniref:ABC transporter permease n=1 Tax=Streptomyces sp. NPDC012935 TaxID=3364857 RepID=UPI0036CE6386